MKAKVYFRHATIRVFIILLLSFLLLWVYLSLVGLFPIFFVKSFPPRIGFWNKVYLIKKAGVYRSNDSLNIESAVFTAWGDEGRELLAEKTLSRDAVSRRLALDSLAMTGALPESGEMLLNAVPLIENLEEAISLHCVFVVMKNSKYDHVVKNLEGKIHFYQQGRGYGNAGEVELKQEFKLGSK